MKTKRIEEISYDARNFTLSLEPVSGGLTFFLAFINGIKVIDSDAAKKRIWSGEIPSSQIKIKIRVVGIGNAIFKIGIDLPGTAEDQSLSLNLNGGYYETEIIL